MNRRASKLIARIGGNRKEKRAWMSLPHFERGKQRTYLEQTMREEYAPVRSYLGLPKPAYALRLCLWRKQLSKAADDVNTDTLVEWR